MTRSISKTLGFSLAAAMLALLLIVPAAAQTGSTTVSGSVADAQGGVLAGATVRLVNAQKGFSRSAVTNSEGAYTFSSVPPDTYSIEVEASGFKKLVVSTVVALVDKPTTANVTLEAGNISEVVNVTGGELASIVNTQDASLGNNFVAKQIQQLPLNARNVGNLLSLQPGVTPDGSVSGSRSDQANITLDGVDVNEQVNGAAFTPVLRVTPDSVDEFRVTTQNADASKGRSSGAQISLITKGGSNDFNGALYEYYRGPKFTANDYFNNANKRDRPGLIRHLYGGSLGGPIKKDKLFFFYNYEAMRESKSTPVNRLVPLASMGQGQLKFRDAGGNVVTVTTAQINAFTGPASIGSPAVVDVNPVAVALFAAAAAKYPSNNCQLGDCLNTGGFAFNSPAPVELNTHTAKFDYNINSQHTFSLRGNYQQDLATGVSRFPDTPGTNTWTHPLGIAAKHTWIIRNNLINNLTYGLTRNAFSVQGDSSANAITFGNQFPIFAPFTYARTAARVTPVHNIADDISLVKGNHTWQFGTNMRFVRNRTDNFARAFDNAVVNETFYATSGNLQPHIPLQNSLGITVPVSQISAVRSVLTSLWGRLTQYTANYNFNLDGTPQAPGTPVTREFATQEYDVYAQDVWKVRPNLTVTAGLRYGISMPIYETSGFETRPNVSLKGYLEKRISEAAQGRNYIEPISVILSGKANKAAGMYSLDTNNFQPRLAAAWSPGFKSGLLGSIFGKNEESVFRGGFAITNDYFGHSLALTWDANNTLGFSASSNINFATYTIYQSGCTVAAQCNPAPEFTGLNQTIRTLQNLTAPAAAKFPQTLSNNLALARIQSSLDTDLVSPIQYSYNFSYGRRLPWGMYLDASYQGRLGRNLFASRDIMQFNNIKDPVSGQTWDEAAGILEWHRINKTPIANIPNLPWFENMYAPGTIGAVYTFGPFNYSGLSNTKAAYAVMSGAGANTTAPDCGTVAIGGCQGYGIDWTALQWELDRFSGKNLFVHPQYAALAAFGTVGNSDYHGATFTLRQRFSGLTWDLNYTFSKSIDDASGLNNAGTFGGGSFILNALRQRDFRSVSDFDLRHVVNANAIWEMPIGKGKRFLNTTNKFVDAVIGGWTMSGVFRYNTGYPYNLSCVGGWPANWQRNSWCQVNEPVQTSPTKAGLTPNNFTDPVKAYRSFRSPGPGGSGSRNALRFPSYIVLDMGMKKSFGMPWSETHKLSLGVSAFNVTNTQRLTGFNTANLNSDPQFGAPPTNWGNFTAIQGAPRILQWSIRYDF